MKTYKIYYMLILIISILSTQDLYSQKVYKNGDGQIILDLGPDSGAPQGAVTDSAGTKVLTTAPNKDNRILGAKNSSVGGINSRLYYKLEIAPSDFSTGSMWEDAYNGCTGLNTGGVTGWRLPTQRELMLIYLFKDYIGELGSAFGASYYWSATEYSATNSWTMNFSNGNTYSYFNKASASYRSKCVREF